MTVSPFQASVPTDWFVDPVALGVPKVRRIVEDESDQLNWQADSLCAQTDPEAFFPEKGGSTREAKRICSSCEVRSDCLEYALQNDERFGIWGGLSERERRKLRKPAGARTAHDAGTAAAPEGSAAVCVSGCAAGAAAQLG